MRFLSALFLALFAPVSLSQYGPLHGREPYLLDEYGSPSLYERDASEWVEVEAGIDINAASAAGPDIYDTNYNAYPDLAEATAYSNLVGRSSHHRSHSTSSHSHSSHRSPRRQKSSPTTKREHKNA